MVEKDLFEGGVGQFEDVDHSYYFSTVVHHR